MRDLLSLHKTLFIRNFGVECPEVSILGTGMGESAPLSPTLRSSGLKLVIAEANRAFVADRLKIDPAIPIGVDDGTSVEISGIRFSAIASAHETVERDEHVRAKYLRYVLEFGGWTIYHSDDTVRYEGMAEKLRSFRTDVALPPINGRVPEKRVPGNLFGRAWAKDMDAKLVVRAISKCSNSIALRRTNSSTNAASCVSLSRCCVAANNGAASLKRKPGVPADAAS